MLFDENHCMVTLCFTQFNNCSNYLYLFINFFILFTFLATLAHAFMHYTEL